MSRRPFLDVFSSALPRPPSGAEPLTPPFGYPGRPAGRPGPQPGPSRARSSWGTCLALRHWEVRAGSGQARAQVGPGPGSGRARGPGPASTSGGFDDWPGGAAAGLPEFGTPGSARTVLTRVGHSVAVSVWCWCVCCLDDPARASRSRPGEECSASTPSRGSLGALWRRVASAAPGSGPFLCSERCAGLGGARAVGFTAGRSRWA